MKGDERTAFNLFAATTNLQAATEVFMEKYERPGVKALAERIDWARKALSAFNSAPAAGPSGAEGSVVDLLRARVDAGKIIFDKPALRDELLGLNAGTKVSSKLQALILKLCDMAPVIRISSLVRPAPGSHHAEGRAVDIGNEEIAAALLPQIATTQQVAALGIDELIFDARRINPSNDPNKFNFDRGVKHDFSIGTINDHGNHIHFAV